MGNILDDKIVDVRAFTLAGPGADYHDRGEQKHWIDDHIASPMAKYPEYRETRSSFGINVLGSLIVEVESASGEVGVGISTGGVPGCWIVENHLSRFVVGACPTDVKRIWDQMYLATVWYGRKGLVMNAISAVDVAIWDLLGRIRQEPVYSLLGGPVRDELVFYATTSRPDLAKEMGFIGGKMPLLHSPSEGDSGFRENVKLLEEMRGRVGNDFWLMYDCWMALDVNYSLKLMNALTKYDLKWLEESLIPDDYWGYAELMRRKPKDMMVATGEHEYGVNGFRMLLDMQCCDIIQPDVGWCGGVTELINIAALAESRNVLVVPHCSSVYSYHFCITSHGSPFTEFLIMAPDADSVGPIFSPVLTGEPVPVDGRLKVPDKPGFGVELNRSLDFQRPFTR